jgi:hypothetical protein
MHERSELDDPEALVFFPSCDFNPLHHRSHMGDEGRA